MVGDDFFGLPEYVINSVVTQPAGNSNVRIYNYVKRGSLLVPQFMSVMTAADLLVASREVENAAHHVFTEEAKERATAHH